MRTSSREDDLPLLFTSTINASSTPKLTSDVNTVYISGDKGTQTPNPTKVLVVCAGSQINYDNEAAR